MATKPTTTYTWDTNTTNVSQPSVSLRSDGYATNDIPTSANYNYQINSIYQWLLYFETVTDALDTLSGVGDITLTVDTDNTSTTNAIIFRHNNPAVELARINESANLILTDATSHTITLGNDALTNANADGTFTVSSQKHITMDIDSDNDGTDGVWKVRANGTTDALSVTEAGCVTAAGPVIGTNITATNATDILALAVTSALGRLTTFTSFTDAEVATIASTVNKPVLYVTGGGSSYLLSIATANDIVRSAAFAADMSLQAANNFTSVSSAVDFRGLAADATFGVGVAAAGALYTSPASGGYATWTSRTSGTANSLGYLSVGGGFWIAYGDTGNNVIVYNDTTDPTDAWTTATSGLSGTTTFKGAAFGAGLHVTITANNEIITSSNATTWTPRTNPTTGTWHNLTFDGTRFWAVGDSGKIISSTNGTSWTDVSVSGGGTIAGAYSVTVGGQTIYICAETNTSSIRWGTTLGTWNILPIDTHTLSSSTGIAYFVYNTTLKRLFIGDTNNDLVFSKALN